VKPRRVCRNSKPERDAEIVRLAAIGYSLAAIGRVFGITDSRVSTILEPHKHRARTAAFQKLREVPETCEDCGADNRLERHHDSYDHALSVRWLCRGCHRAADRAMRERQARQLLGLSPDAEILSLAEFATATRTWNIRVRNAIDAGEIRAARVSRTIRLIPASEVPGWIARKNRFQYAS
jgi:cytochrome c553